MNRDVAAAFLRAAGHAVVEAGDGDAALRLVAAEIFDVVLMDLRMPVLDGIEATRHIRMLPGQHGQTPVIAVTADVQEDQGAALRAAGFQAWLVKPIDQMSLLAAVAVATDGGNATPAPPLAVPPRGLELPPAHGSELPPAYGSELPVAYGSKLDPTYGSEVPRRRRGDIEPAALWHRSA